MMTSTPTDSPRRRRISRPQTLVMEEDTEDLEQELKNRRLEAINKSSEVRRRSVAPPLLTGMDAAQLAKHCKDCIKLSTENKINTKNAFSFLLIDMMAAMAKKKDSEINKNFQMASCTLDASVKIYGCRVDFVHTEAMKIASGFIGKALDNVESGDEDKEEEEVAGKGKPKKKKKRKKLTVVNSDTLNSKSEAEMLLDVVPRQNLLAREGDGSDLLVKIPKLNDAGLLIIDSDLPCWSEESARPSKEELDHAELMEVFHEIAVPEGFNLCPSYSKFDFCKSRDCEEESDEELDASQNKFDFDVNATMADIEEAEMDIATPEAPRQRTRLEIPLGGYDSNDEIALPVNEMAPKTKKIAIGDMKKRVSVNNLEYSLFDEKVLKSWAGPKYWKVRPTLTKISEENKENEDASKQVPNKRTRKGKVKGAVGLFEVCEDVLAKYLATGDKSTLCMQTMLNWSSRNTTMPKDCKYSSRTLFTLYHLPVVVEPELESAEVEEDSIDQDEPNEELEYCSSLVIQDHEDVQDEECPPPGPADDRPEVEIWDKDNMVAAPNKVGKIVVSSFKRKRHVDIKHLKKSIWTILDTPCTEAPVDFKEIVQTCPTRLVTNGASLSTPLIFNALLHLANEKGLLLSQDRIDKTDFKISLTSTKS